MPKLKKTRTCWRCRAYSSLVGCELGYNQELYAVCAHDDSSNGIPQEPCPKPLTYDQLFASPKKPTMIK